MWVEVLRRTAFLLAAAAGVVGATRPCAGPTTGLAVGLLGLVSLVDRPRLGFALAIACIAFFLWTPLREVERSYLLAPALFAFVRLCVCSPRLAVGVGTAALLWAVSLPNVFCFSCKSKQSEAKTNLSGLYTAERAYFGEHGRFTADLAALPWSPDGSPLYLYGFRNAGGAATDTSEAGLTGFSRERMRALSGRRSASGFAGRRAAGSGRPLGAWDLPPSFASTTAFVAVAVGDIASDDPGPPDLDVWAIDERRRLVNLANDCAE